MASMVNDQGPGYGLYILYYDVYGGWTPDASTEWFQMDVVERHSSHYRVVTAPPILFANDWTYWWQSLFHYTSSVNVYVRKSFLADGDFSYCGTRSTVVFGH